MNNYRVVHPFLLALFPVFALYSANAMEVNATEVVVPALGSIIIATAVFILLNLALKNRIKAGICTSLFLVLFFSYGHIFNLLSGANFFGLDIGKSRYLVPLLTVALLCGFYFTIRSVKELGNLTRFLNFVGVALLAVSIITSGARELEKYRAQNMAKEAATGTGDNGKQRAVIENTKGLPDIYYIIFDRYSSEAALRKYLDFDNSDFVRHLEKQGFYVASKSRSNYEFTHVSLSSSLNMRHHTQRLSLTGYYAMLQDYEVWRFLKSKGYRYLHYGSYWAPTKRNEYADQNINYFFPYVSPFSQQLLETTMINPFFGGVGYKIQDYEGRRRILEKFDHLAKADTATEPKFVFAHVLVPHKPYLFTKDGKPLSRSLLQQRSELENYKDYMIFVNGKIKVMVDKIISNSKNPPIIILQADEGLRAKSLKEWRYGDDAAAAINMQILNAYYVPGADKGKLYESITPVNTFRFIFNEYFGAKYKYLPDKSYLEGKRDFKDVTNLVEYD